jgi:hypothetical protein
MSGGSGWFCLVAVIALSGGNALAQVPTTNQNTNINPRIRNTVNPQTNSNATGGNPAATANPTSNATSRGGAAMANPAASSGATANPSASSGSSAVTISTGNTTFPSGQSIMSVPTVYVPSVATGNVCALGASGGASWLGAGFAFGSSWESMQCERRQTAALLWNMNTPESKAAAKEVLCNSPEIREAYARAGSPCTVDLMRVAGAAQPQQRPTIAPQPMTASFDPAAYRSGADCLTAAQAAGAPLSVCAGKP